MKEVRAKLVLRGTSFAAFCAEHGFVRQHVGDVVAGKRDGKKARELVQAFMTKLRETE